MKKIMCLGVSVLLVIGAFAQEPLKWAFTATKIGDKTYELHLTANMEDSWHTYSQMTPEGGPMPTRITFVRNPLIILEGDTKEIGKLEKIHDKTFDVEVDFFSGKVDFVQVIKLTVDVKTRQAGTISYMVCDDHQCIFPKPVPFEIELN